MVQLCMKVVKAGMENIVEIPLQMISISSWFIIRMKLELKQNRDT